MGKSVLCFSFLIFQNQKDAILNLKNRRSFGLGVKVSLPLGLSLSYALLPEEEIYDWELYRTLHLLMRSRSV